MSTPRNQYVPLESKQAPSSVEPQTRSELVIPVSQETKRELPSNSTMLKVLLAQLNELEKAQITAMEAKEKAASRSRWYLAGGSFLILAGLAWGIFAPFIGSNRGFDKYDKDPTNTHAGRYCDENNYQPDSHTCVYGYGNNPENYGLGWSFGGLFIAIGMFFLKIGNDLRKDPQGLEEKVSFSTYAHLAKLGLLPKRKDNKDCCAPDGVVGTVTRRELMKEITESKSQLTAHINKQVELENTKQAKEKEETPPDYQQVVLQPLLSAPSESLAIEMSHIVEPSAPSTNDLEQPKESSTFRR